MSRTKRPESVTKSGPLDLISSCHTRRCIFWRFALECFCLMDRADGAKLQTCSAFRAPLTEKEDNAEIKYKEHAVFNEPLTDFVKAFGVLCFSLDT